MVIIFSTQHTTQICESLIQVHVYLKCLNPGSFTQTFILKLPQCIERLNNLGEKLEDESDEEEKSLEFQWWHGLIVGGVIGVGVGGCVLYYGLGFYVFFECLM